MSSNERRTSGRNAPGIDRRRFLKLVGTSTGSLALPVFSLADDTGVQSFNDLVQTLEDGSHGHVIVNRPRDLLSLRVDFLNLTPRKPFFSSPVLEPIDDNRSSFLIITLPGQHVLEERSLEGGPAPALPVPAFLSAHSTLVFHVPEERLPLGFDIESLLNWREFQLVRRPPGLPLCRPLKETSIVFPSRLSFVPDGPVTVTAAVQPRELLGRTELWRADLSNTALRAIWTPDHKDAACDDVAGVNPSSLEGPLRAEHRRDIALSARRPSATNQNARPVDARVLTLSPLGAWADVRGAWDPPARSDLIEWENLSIMGRDQRVKIARGGYLYPWGHKAVLIELTERKILASPGGPDAAYLRNRFFIVITQPLREYPHPDDDPDLGYPEQPLRTVEFITRKTPTLDAWSPSSIPDGNIGGQGAKAFWPRVGGREFRFAIEGRDWVGRLSSTEVTAIFVGLEQARDPVVMTEVKQAYSNELSSSMGTPVTVPGLRTSVLSGQPVAFAAENEPDDTTVETSSLTFEGAPRQGAAPDDLDWPFSPVMDTAAVRIPSIGQIAGFSEDLEVTYDVRFDPAHPENNPAELFLMVNNTPQLDFASLGADRSGGVATPNMDIGAVSRSTGPVGNDVDGLAAGNFQPGGFFPADAELLGGVKMGDVLQNAKVKDIVPFCDGSSGSRRSSMPKFGATYKLDDTDSGGDLDFKHQVCFQLDWETTKIKSFLPLFEVGDNPCLRLQVTVCVGDTLDFTQQRGRITDFSIMIPNVIRLNFAYFDFERVEGRPLRVDVELEEKKGRNKVELLAALKWIDKLVSWIKDKLPGGGKGGGLGKHFDYDISPQAVKLFAKHEIRNISLSVLSLSNIQLRLGLELPLLGKDGCLFIFEFSTRKNPFGITVGTFGGGGHFGIGFVTNELRRIEGALEFGGRYKPDIVGAEGEVYLMVGVYYTMKVEDGQRRQELAAYVRAGGSMKIIKLIHISVEFYLVLTYIEAPGDEDDNSLCGEATITVTISIAFFSAGVSMTFRKCFKGGDPDNVPDSAQLTPLSIFNVAIADSHDGESPMGFSQSVNGRDGWREYWQAFSA